MSPGDSIATDVLLLPFLDAAEDAAEQHLGEIIASQTETTIKGIVRSQLGVSLLAGDGSADNQDALELVVDVQADLLAAFRRLRSDGTSGTVANLQSYVAAAAYNACHQLLRRKYPERQRLKNKLRYLLTHTAEFALWQSPDWDWRCGLAAWHSVRTDVANVLDLTGLRERLPHRQPGSAGESSRTVLVDLLLMVFRGADRPVRLAELVTLVAGILDIRDTSRDNSAFAPGTAGREAPGHVEPTAHASIEQRAGLDAMWSAICKLPLRHRAALLLNLRDRRGGDALALLPHTGVANVDQIAAVLEYPADEFARIWNDLPWDDLTIGRHLGLSRQQVINLRQSARARLAREWKDF